MHGHDLSLRRTQATQRLRHSDTVVDTPRMITAHEARECCIVTQSHPTGPGRTPVVSRLGAHHASGVGERVGVAGADPIPPPVDIDQAVLQDILGEVGVSSDDARDRDELAPVRLRPRLEVIGRIPICHVSDPRIPLGSMGELSLWGVNFLELLRVRCSIVCLTERFTGMTSLAHARRIGLIATAVVGLTASALLAAPSQAAETPVAVGDCLDVEDSWSNTSPYTVVDCEAEHNGEVYDIVPYPTRAGAPSTLSEEEISRISDECSFIAYDAWLGKDISLPTRIWSWFVSLPSDDAWADGDREVLCRTMRPTASYQALRYTGAIPDLIASTPIEQWLNCMPKAPKSGKPNPTRACDAKTPWLLLGGEPVKGKVTAKYPQDLQAAADKACVSAGKAYAKKGTKPIAALLPKSSVASGSVYTECFIPMTQWNGKVR